MLINSQTALDAFIEFNAHFKSGLTEMEAKQTWDEIADRVTSETESENYTWLRDLPGVREWVGQRQVQSLAQSDYLLTNKDWEGTVGVPRNAFNDNKTSSFDKPMEALGRSVGKDPDKKIWNLLKEGHVNICHDGVSFFNAAHPLGDSGGTFSNSQAGGGAAWYLLALDEVVKPLIYQVRQEPVFVSFTDPKDNNVFLNKEYIFGVDYRAAHGYTLPELAYRSAADLDETNFDLALQAMGEAKSWEGRELEIKPTHLVCGYANRAKANALIKALVKASGATNTNAGAVDLIVSPYL